MSGSSATVLYFERSMEVNGCCAQPASKRTLSKAEPAKKGNLGICRLCQARGSSVKREAARHHLFALDRKPRRESLRPMSIDAGKSKRNPLALGWEAAKANAVPGFILQGMMLLLLIAYYLSPSCAEFLNRLAQYKQQHGLVFVVVAAAGAGALVPGFFVVVFFQRGRFCPQNPRNLAVTVSDLGVDRVLVGLVFLPNARR